MNKKGVFVIKPDFINKNRIQYVLNEIEKACLQVNEVYKIDDFKKYSTEYRFRELSRQENPCQYKFKEVMQTIAGYEKKHINKGLMLIIENQDELSDEEFFERLHQVKKEIRNNYVANREYSDYLVTGPYGSKLITEKFSTYDSLKKLYGDNISLMHFNGIHLEDYDEYVDQFNYNYAVNSGIISDKNQMDTNKFYSTFANDREMDR